VLAAAVPTKFTNEVRVRASAIVEPAAVSVPEDERAGADDSVSFAITAACSGGIPKPIKSVTNGIKTPKK
jgi:hypothetical protein